MCKAHPNEVEFIAKITTEFEFELLHFYFTGQIHEVIGAHSPPRHRRKVGKGRGRAAT